MNSDRFLIVVTAILLAGLVGGVASYWIEHNDVKKGENINWTKMIGLVWLGIAASSISPLFLEIFNAGGDSLIFSLFSRDTEKADKFAPYVLLLFAYCCLFSVFARRFISSAFDQFTFINNLETKALDRAGNIAEETAKFETQKQSKHLVQDQAEEMLETVQGATSFQEALSADLSPAEWELLLEIGRSRTGVISFESLRAHFSDNDDELRRSLSELEKINFIRSHERDSEQIWSLRLRGAARLKQLEGTRKKQQ